MVQRAAPKVGLTVAAPPPETIERVSVRLGYVHTPCQFRQGLHTRICLAEDVRLAHAYRGSNVSVKLIDIADDTGVAHKALHCAAWVVVMSICCDILLHGRVLSSNELLGAPSWWSRVRITSLDNVRLPKGTSHLDIPIVLRCCVCRGCP